MHLLRRVHFSLEVKDYVESNSPSGAGNTIGDDRANIERIYGAGYLDITDLNQLPVMLTQLIARNLPK